MTIPRWLPPVGIALAAGLFTWLNRGERIVVHLGIATFYGAPLTVVLFLAFLAGMLAMLALSLRHDLRMRQELRARGLLVPAPGQGSPVLAPSPPAPHAHVPAVEPEETAGFSDDRTARFQGDGAGLRVPYHVDGDGGEHDPTLIHQRDNESPPR
ncbi:MAG: LapA family protein [Gemmatimonadetes bacterium]|nr:LapA family protein [Gemmatimonadota bacterium]